MKKLLILSLLITACSKLEFKYDSNVDYSLYKKAYVVEIYNDTQELTFNEEEMMNLFCSDLEQKSGFNTVYQYYTHPELVDSVLPQEYLVIKLIVKKAKYNNKEKVADNGDVSFYYEATITLLCQAYSNDKLIFQIEKDSEYDNEYNYDESGNFDEVKRTALKKALQEIAKYFTKSYVI